VGTFSILVQPPGAGLTKGEYWVLDDDYQTALVGHPNRKYLWLLTRDQQE
jgi:lipocalin